MKPGDFLIGLRDFFAVLIPGAVLTFLIASFAEVAGEDLPSWWTALADTFDRLGAAERTLAYAIIAYACGQVVASLSSLLDLPIDAFERSFGQNTGKYFLWGIDPQARLVTYRRLATDLKNEVACRLLGGSDAGCEKIRIGIAAGEVRELWSTKSFWKDFLRLCEPVATTELDRIESTEKLFRSLAVVFLLVASATGWNSNWSAAGAALIAFAVCFYLYARFRLGFMYRLYKLAVLTSFDAKVVKELADDCFPRLRLP
jgi:hypothetical protein